MMAKASSFQTIKWNPILSPPSSCTTSNGADCALVLSLIFLAHSNGFMNEAPSERERPSPKWSSELLIRNLFLMLSD